ncbi:hypothetical protein N6H18_00960 [Reichenbachiella agarivorans]|uniref:Dialkylrecorsinol condensing enzyme n=1 Tax=Reichenbachiella agarivorans TaxID=2979464 RepID=A0ABY6CPU7_9BACT|nr:hypothetical protein [Reichenbachiella agarivorans]UXP32546.1 hypothetical protein N6H18_00960 [Reichenbachiella agarivorans]
MKKILAINYSQTGQLDEILDRFLIPFGEVERVKVQVKRPFGFPWSSERFFDAMPESVLEEPVDLEPMTFANEEYDLIILGYQPWFLSPSIPTTSLLKNEKFKQIIKGKPVVTVIGARNMWLNAQDSVKTMLREAGATLVGNIPLIDRSNNLTSVVSILHWMLDGKKTKPLGIFPKPGVSDEDIQYSDRFGVLVKESMDKGDYVDLQSQILSLNRISVPTNILFIEQRAKKLFQIWANIIKKKGTTAAKRKRWLVGFKYYLIIALFVVSPIVLTIFNLLLRPFTLSSIKRKKEYYCGVN